MHSALIKILNNCKSQGPTHRGGAKPFIQHALRAARNGKTLSFIDNWETMYQNSERRWVSETAKEKHCKMITKREELKVRRIQETAEGSSNSIPITVNDEIPIMAEECGRKGKRVCGLGSFPHLEIPTSFSVPVDSEWIKMQENYKQLSSIVQTMQSENKRLKKMLISVLKNKNTRKTNSSGLDDVNSNLIPNDAEGGDEEEDGAPRQ
ncbi:hypothetical protein M0R45_031312 [Rubus argutus]|uniref:Uncharacterized protein n=1 Tax=Rubus argutus TaxID=59490 RepID=A0AAW1WEB0_RUBAR